MIGIFVSVIVETTVQSRASQGTIKADLDSVNWSATSLSLPFDNSTYSDLQNNDKDTWTKKSSSVTSTMKTIGFGGRTSIETEMKSPKAQSNNGSREFDLRIDSSVIDRDHLSSFTTVKRIEPDSLEKGAVISAKTRPPTSDQIPLLSVPAEALVFMLPRNQHSTSHIMQNTPIVS